MSLRNFAVQMLEGDEHAPLLFVEDLPDEVRAQLEFRLHPLIQSTHGRMLRDVEAFMAFKVPDPKPSIGLPLFREALDLALAGDQGKLGRLVEASSLYEAYILNSIGNRLVHASRQRPLLRGAPITIENAQPLAQKELF